MRRVNRRRAAFLLAVLSALMNTMPVTAGVPRVQVDETMYVNLDYYGKKADVNVVKGCTPNGVSQYTDYGNYEKLVNMTDRTEPVKGDGTVTWTLPEDGSRFYFQGTIPEENVELPWNFDVSYKLNGVETDAASLLHASGLVELNVKAKPNKNTRAYYRNNMILTVIVPVDMEKCYSVDAPGSQLQSVGSSKAVMFMALPGEEGDYTVRIGTDDFESSGIFMMMVPGTASAFDHIKDIKEAKDTWRESGDRMYDSINELLLTMESMRQDVSQVKGGVDELEQARASINSNRKQIEALSTEAIAQLQGVADQTAVLIPYLQTAQNAVSDINSNANAIYNTMEDMQDELDRLYDRLGSLRNALSSASSQISKGITSEEQAAVGEIIAAETEELQKIFDALENALNSADSQADTLDEDSTELEDSLDFLDAARISGAKSENSEDEDSREKSESLGKADGQEEPDGSEKADIREESDGSEAPDSTPKESEDAQVIAFGEESDGNIEIEEDRRGPSGEPGSGGVNDADFEEEMSEAADEAEEALQALSGTSYISDVRRLSEESRGMIRNGRTVEQGVSELIARINAACRTMGGIGEDTASTISALRRSDDELINLLDDTRVLIDTMDSYVPSMLDALADSQELANRLTRALYSLHDLLALLNNTWIAAGDSLDAGTRDSLQGLGGLLDKSLSMIDSIAGVRQAGEEMKDTLDEQLDKFEEENQFLNLDPSADKISFTSSKNPSPSSIQIILRTEEISDEDKTTDISDLETEEQANEGPFQRMWNVIKAIFEAVIDIFRNR